MHESMYCPLIFKLQWYDWAYHNLCEGSAVFWFSFEFLDKESYVQLGLSGCGWSRCVFFIFILFFDSLWMLTFLVAVGFEFE